MCKLKDSIIKKQEKIYNPDPQPEYQNQEEREYYDEQLDDNINLYQEGEILFV